MAQAKNDTPKNAAPLDDKAQAKSDAEDQKYGPVAQDQRTTDDLIQKPGDKVELHDSQVRAFARTRGLELPAKGRLSAARAGEIKQAFADEWKAATEVFDRRVARLQNEWDKATAHLTPYAEDAAAGTAAKQAEAPVK
jgi:hypothetical protein